MRPGEPKTDTEQITKGNEKQRKRSGTSATIMTMTTTTESTIQFCTKLPEVLKHVQQQHHVPAKCPIKIFDKVQTNKSLCCCCCCCCWQNTTSSFSSRCYYFFYSSSSLVYPFEFVWLCSSHISPLCCIAYIGLRATTTTTGQNESTYMSQKHCAILFHAQTHK